jgi:regulation of enolase protein 1 (concanavalin A-like superfamily)
VPNFQNTGTNASIGVMIRDTLTAGSKYSHIGVDGSGTIKHRRRTSTGGSTTTAISSNGAAPNLWFRVTRAGNTVRCYKGTNGTTWVQVDSRNISMASSCYMGLVVDSGSTNTLNTSQFDNVTPVP